MNNNDILLFGEKKNIYFSTKEDIKEQESEKNEKNKKDLISSSNI
jgi:hypothetical protein